MDPTFAGTNAAENDGHLIVKTMHSTTFFGGEVGPSVPCRKICGTLKNPTSMKEIFVDKIQRPFLRKVSPASFLDVSACNCQTALVNESRMIRKQMGKTKRLEMVAVQGPHCGPISQGWRKTCSISCRENFDQLMTIIFSRRTSLHEIRYTFPATPMLSCQ
jgi:hypothetical protein